MNTGNRKQNILCYHLQCKCCGKKFDADNPRQAYCKNCGIKKCEICGNFFHICPSKDHQRYCSLKCKNLAMKEILKGKNKGRVMGKKQREKNSIAHKGLIPWNKGTPIKKFCQLCGKVYYVKASRKDRTKYCSRHCANIVASHSPNRVASWVKSIHNRPNNLEKKIIAICKEYNLPYVYVGSGDFILAGKNPDFLNTDGKKNLIEIFGDAFHQPEEENQRYKLFSHYGFRTLVLWESKLKKLTPRAIANKIREFDLEAYK